MAKKVRAGIYKILNKTNSKFYIGSTINFDTRKATHFYRFRKIKGNSALRSAIAKYGVESFEFIEIEEMYFSDSYDKECRNEILECREQYYIDDLNPEYNIRKKDVTRNIGIRITDEFRKHLSLISRRPMTQETKLKISKTREERKYKGENSPLHIKISVFDKNMNFIEEVNGVRETGRKYNLSDKCIVRSCKNRMIGTCINGYIFKYSNDLIKKNNFRKRRITKGFKHKIVKSIYQYDIEGNFIKEWRCAEDATKELKLYDGAISRVLSGKFKGTKGYVFKSNKI